MDDWKRAEVEKQDRMIAQRGGDYLVVSDEGYRAVGRSLPVKGRVLDLGCGTGPFAKWIAQSHPCEIVGLDLSFKSLAIARDVLAHPVVGDAVHLPFAEDSFDTVFCGFTLHHVLPEIGLVLEECARVLRPDGCICLAEESMDSPMANKHSQDHERPLHKAELHAWFSDLGFNLRLWPLRHRFFITPGVPLYRLRTLANRVLACLFPYLVAGVARPRLRDPERP